MEIEQVKSVVPYYYFPTIKNLKQESLSIGKNAYQLLYFGQYKESLNLANLAIKINKTDEKQWLILLKLKYKQTIQERFKVYNKVEKINSDISEIYLQKVIFT